MTYCQSASAANTSADRDERRPRPARPACGASAGRGAAPSSAANGRQEEGDGHDRVPRVLRPRERERVDDQRGRERDAEPPRRRRLAGPGRARRSAAPPRGPRRSATRRAASRRRSRRRAGRAGSWSRRPPGPGAAAAAPRTRRSRRPPGCGRTTAAVAPSAIAARIRPSTTAPGCERRSSKRSCSQTSPTISPIAASSPKPDRRVAGARIAQEQRGAGSGAGEQRADHLGGRRAHSRASPLASRRARRPGR